MFHGLTDDTLARAAAILGDHAIAAARRESALATYTRLGASWWRDRLSRWQPPSAAALTSLRLSPTGDGFWLVGTGSQSTPVKTLKGYSYLRELLRRPGIPVAAIDLVTAGAGAVEQPGLGPVLDSSALRSYRQRLHDLDADIAEAGDWSDPARREALEAERDALVDELTAAAGLGEERGPSAPAVNAPGLPPPKPSPQPSTGSPRSTNPSAATYSAPSRPAQPAPTSPTPTTRSTGSSTELGSAAAQPHDRLLPSSDSRGSDHKPPRPAIWASRGRDLRCTFVGTRFGARVGGPAMAHPGGAGRGRAQSTASRGTGSPGRTAPAAIVGCVRRRDRPGRRPWSAARSGPPATTVCS